MPSSSHLVRFFKHSSVYLVGNLVNRVGAFLLLPLYTHYLTVSEYGALELLYAVMAVISSILAIGLAHATLRFYFEYESLADRRALISTNLIASSVITITGVLMVSPWAGLLSERVFGDAGYTTSIYLVLVTIVFELSSQVSLAYLRAIERSGLFVAIAFGKLVVQVATNTYLVMVLQAGVQGVILGNLLTVVGGWAVLTTFTLRQCGFAFHRNKAGPVLRYSYPFLLSTLVGLVSSNADRFLIGGMLSMQALGLYALSMKFSSLLQELIGEPFNRAYGSFRFSIMHDSDADQIQSRIVRYLLVVGVTAALGIAYFMVDVVRLISAPEYWPAVQIVPVLLVASILKVLTYPMQTGILYNKLPRQIFFVNLVSACVSVLANYLLIPIMGLYGACAALVITAATDMVLTNRISQRYFRVRYEYRRWLVLLVIISVYFSLGIIAAQQAVWVAFVLKVLLYLAFIGTVLVSPVVGLEELRSLKTLRARIQSGAPAAS